MIVQYMLRITFTITLIITVGSNALADPIVSLDDCLELEFRDGEVTPQGAMETGECYLSLVTQTETKDKFNDENKDETKAKHSENTGRKIYSIHTNSAYSDSTYLQYADSWFQFAAAHGHPLASQRIEVVRQQLTAND